MNAWHALENRRFPRCFNIGKIQDEIVKNVKMGQTWVPSRDDSSATAGPIGMGQTRVGREMTKLANAESVKYWRASRALLEALSVRNDVFWAFFRIYIGTRTLLEARTKSRRSFLEECTGFEMHLKDRHSNEFLML